MKRIEIELLLRWAYRDELVKRLTSSAEGVWDRVADVGFYGIVDTVSVAQRYDVGEPHPDAVALELAVGRLSDTAIDWEMDAEPVLGHLLALVEPRAITEDVALPQRSTVVSWRTATGHRRSAQLAPPRQIILVRTLRTSALVIMHAMMGTRPDWREEHPHPLPTPATRGPNAMVVGECKRKGWYSDGAYCPIKWWPSAISVAEARADYLAWWRGLAQLAHTVELQDHQALPPSAPEMPWNTL